MKGITILGILAAAVSAAPSSNEIPQLVHPIDDISREGRIVGGQQTTSSSQYPYQALVRYQRNFLCGGSIYTSRWIVSAAHCVDGRSVAQFTIQVGTNQQSGGVIFEVIQAIKHESYGNFQNDIGLYQTASAIGFTPNIQPIDLQCTLPAAGSNVVISGWGRTSTSGSTSSVLKYVSSTLQSSSKCSSDTGINHSSVICFLNSAGQGTCNGDSGGPANYNGRLLGAVSFGVGGCASGRSDGFASIPHFCGWIRTRTGTLDEQNEE